MEFQLNPEHLGKLTIQIASKDGIVSAQITAQNLAVKEVIESQIVQLRDNMNNQGLKVDAVEVTVESHEFERNLDERNSNANQEQFEQQEKNSRRQFNYYDSDTLEDMSAEEALIAEMMIGNGNSINYTA
jgi:flagellar hook-length control protein FliK